MPTNDHDTTPTPAGHVGSTDELGALVWERRPRGIPLHMSAGCCTWDTFLTGFADAWPRWFDAPPTSAQWLGAKRDWMAGNTGWEAAHNAQRRVKERVQKREHDAWADAKGVLTKAARG